MRRAVDADTSSLTMHLAGTFTPTEAHWRDGDKAFQLNTRLLPHQIGGRPASGVRRRRSVTVFEQLAAIKVGDPERTRPAPTAVPGTPARRPPRHLRRIAARTTATLGGDQSSLGGIASLLRRAAGIVPHFARDHPVTTARFSRFSVHLTWSRPCSSRGQITGRGRLSGPMRKDPCTSSPWSLV